MPLVVAGKSFLFSGKSRGTNRIQTHTHSSSWLHYWWHIWILCRMA